jgi:trigger factor
MDTEVNEAGPFERMLTVHMEESELDGAKTRAARKLSQSMKIKGFRPGKAPRAVVERMVGEGTLRTEAIELALPEVIGNVLRETELNPVTTPRVEGIRDGDDGTVEIDVRITLWPELEQVPFYKDRKITVDIPPVSESDIDDQVERVRSQFAELEDVDRPAIDGDFVMVNITTLIDGEQLEDASASDLLYEVGSRSFIQGLDEILMGVEKGGITEGPGTLPEGFGDHGGETVTLRALVKGVRAKKLPEVTDEWVSDVSEFETIEELRGQLEENLSLMRLNQVGVAFQDTLVGELVEEMDLEVPEALVEAEMEASIRNLAGSLEERGIDLSNYLRLTGQSEQQFVDEIRQRASRALKTRILFEGVASSEGISVDDADYDAALASLAGPDTDIEEVRKAVVAAGQEHVLHGDILRRKALERLVASATAIDAEGNPIDLTPPQPEVSDADGDLDEASDEVAVEIEGETSDGEDGAAVDEDES